MSSKGKEILERFADSIQYLTDSEKERVLSFAEGVAYVAAARQSQQQPATEREKGA